MTEDIELWFDAMAKTGTEVVGIASSFAGGSGNQDGVQPMIDEELLQTPAAVWSYGGADIVAAQDEVQTHTVTLTIWIDRQPVAAAYAAAVAFVDRVLTAFPPHAKARLASTHVQSSVITRIGAPEPRTWPEGSERQFIVLPVTFQVRVKRAAPYAPA